MFFSKKFKSEKKIIHCFFSRKGGISTGIYESLNCGYGSNDAKKNIKKNREIALKKININSSFLATVNQKHTNKVQIINHANYLKKMEADAMVTNDKNIALGIFTADCAPVLFFEKKKNLIGAAHAGWKGAYSGVLENTIKKILKLGGTKENIHAAIGPHIGKLSYEVGEDFLSKFIAQNKEYKVFFTIKDNKNYKYLFNLGEFIKYLLKKANIGSVEIIQYDTFSESNQFFSYRRSLKHGYNDYGRCLSVIKLNL